MSWRDSWLLGIILSFIGWEVYAHYFEHNDKAHTLSDLTGKMESRWPATRWLVRGFLALLWWHLVDQEYQHHKRRKAS